MAFSEIADFTGGINTSVDSRLIEKNEAVYSVDANLRSGSLIAQKTSNATGETALSGNNVIYYEAHTKTYSKSTDSFFVEYNGLLYYTDSAGSMKRYDGTTESALGGWTAPSVIPTAVASATAGALNGNYQYCYTYVYSGFFESPPSPYTASIAIASKQGTITFTDTAVASVTARRLYRMGGINQNFNLIAEIPKATTSYTDISADADILFVELSSFTNDAPLSGLDMLTETYGTFFAALGSNIYFSNQGMPEYWGKYNFITLPATVTGLGKLGASIIAFTATEMFEIDGYNRDNIQLTKLPFAYGCVNKRTVKSLDRTLIWVSSVKGENVVCLFDGNSVQRLSDKFPKYQDTNIGDMVYDSFSTETFNNYTQAIRFAEVYDKAYYLVLSTKIRIFDFYTGSLKIYILSGSYDALFRRSGKLYGSISNVVYDLYPDFSTYKNLSHRTGKLTTDSQVGSKQFRRVRVNAKGVWAVTVLVDGANIITSSLESFFLPAATSGVSIEFLITSIAYAKIDAIVYEYEVLAL